MHSAPKSKGFAIQTDRFWSKWRRHRDGASDSPSPAPRSLKQLLKQVEKGTQVRRSGQDRLLAELKLHRDATSNPDLQSALSSFSGKWKLGQLIDIDEEEAKEDLRRLSAAALSIVAQSARGADQAPSRARPILL